MVGAPRGCRRPVWTHAIVGSGLHARVVRFAAGALYAISFVAESLFAWHLWRQRRDVLRRQQPRDAMATHMRAGAFESPRLAQQQVDGVERATLTTGWPLALFVVGFVSGYAGSFVSLIA